MHTPDASVGERIGLHTFDEDPRYQTLSNWAASPEDEAIALASNLVYCAPDTARVFWREAPDYARTIVWSMLRPAERRLLKEDATVTTYPSGRIRFSDY